MDEKMPLLRPLIRRESGRLRWEVFLSAIVISCFIILGAVIQKSPNPRQSPYAVPEVQFQVNGDQFSWANITPSRTLQWHSCFNAEYDCARLDVPMDWQDPTDDARVILAIARLRATETDSYQGSVFFNPGGPGGSGVWALKDHGKHIQTVVGKNHDIITFDPRGISASVPRIECWGSAQRRHNWAMQETPVIDSHPGVFYDVFARATAFSEACEKSHNDTGFLQYIGTASHARDMLEILDQLDEEKLQYWGFSYGTILGGTFAALYPQRVGRLVSDGNVDLNEWYNSAHMNAVRDADKVMDAFYELCHKVGPAGCAFHGSSPANIKERHQAILDGLRADPIIYMPESSFGSELPELITYSKIRKLAATSLYRPNYYFTHLAEILAGLEKQDGKPYYEFVTRFGLPFSNVCTAEQIPPTEPLSSEAEGNDDAFPTILCADGMPITDSARDFEKHVDQMEEISSSTGAIVIKDRIACAGRQVRPKWRFNGPFEVRTSFPILFVANIADNITPLISARNNSAGFEDSVVLVQNSYGHTSLSAPSTCTSKAIRAYFQNGTLPAADATCEADMLPFGVRPSAVIPTSAEEDELALATWELSLKVNWGIDKQHFRRPV